MIAVQTPYTQFFGTDGSPLDNGYLYIGLVSQNPETAPAQVFWDFDGTQPAAQPIRLLNGYPARDGTPTPVFTPEDYSFAVKNARGGIEYTSSFSPSISTSASDVLGKLANQTNTSLGATLVSWIRNAVNALGRTVSDKLSDIVNIKDFAGADGSAKLTAASAVSKNVQITSGTFNFPTTPVVNGIVDIWGNAVISGPGLAALGYVLGVPSQTIQNGTTGTDFAARYIRRNALHTGGAPGAVSAALRVETYVGAGAANYEWAFVSKLDTSATGGQNVAGYLQTIKRGTGPGWAGVFELIEPATVNDPLSGSVPVEIDLRANGTDAFNNRVGVDLVITRRDVAGPALAAGYGYRLQTANDALTTVTFGYGFAAGTKVVAGFDTSQATCLQAAYKMAQGQSIVFDAPAITSYSYDGTGLSYSISGLKKSRLSNDGGIELFGLRTKIFGTFSTGATTPNLGANKPGATTAPSVWLRVDIDGTQGVIPWWPL
jgi:hypothetical protein